jgi:hypothetical protein
MRPILLKRCLAALTLGLGLTTAQAAINLTSTGGTFNLQRPDVEVFATPDGLGGMTAFLNFGFETLAGSVAPELSGLVIAFDGDVSSVSISGQINSPVVQPLTGFFTPGGILACTAPTCFGFTGNIDPFTPIPFQTGSMTLKVDFTPLAGFTNLQYAFGATIFDFASSPADDLVFDISTVAFDPLATLQNTGVISPIPEPGAVSLFALGLVSIAAHRARSRRRLAHLQLA